MLSRRAALTRMGAALLGAAAATGCAPTFVGRMLYPEADKLDDATVDRVLKDFVTAVLPGFEQPERIASLFADETLRFAPFRRAFAADLQRRAQRLVPAPSFDRLTSAQRLRVIEEGLESRGPSARLFHGAVLLVQVAWVAGLWNDHGACPAIGFDGAHQFRGYDEQRHPDCDAFLPAATTADGNPA